MSHQMRTPVITEHTPLHIGPDGHLMVNMPGLGFVRVAECRFEGLDTEDGRLPRIEPDPRILIRGGDGGTEPGEKGGDVNVTLMGLLDAMAALKAKINGDPK